MDIIFKYKLDLLVEPASAANFIATHATFVSPSYVLQDHVTLYNVTRTEAVFVESSEGVDVAHSSYGSFMRASQFEQARRLIIIPINAFHDLSEQVGDPKGRIVFESNTSRCGSTLLCQMFEETGCCVGYSEPESFNAIAALQRSIPQEELDKLARSCVRLQCKPSRSRSVTAHILKLIPPTIGAAPVLHRLYPDAKLLFMYREGLKVAQSIVKISSKLPIVQFTLRILPFHPSVSQNITKELGAEDFKVQLSSALTFGVFVWAIHCRKYIDLRQKEGIDIRAIKYEDLVERPVEAARAIFRFCDLPSEFAEKAVRALNKDSQKHSLLSMKSFNKVKKIELSEQDRVVVHAICDQLDLPRIPEPCDLPGTITTFKSSQANGTSHRNGIL